MTVFPRFESLEGQLRRVMAVIKMRGSNHSKDWRSFEITEGGLRVGPVLSDYRGILSGIPVPRADGGRIQPGLTQGEVAVPRALEEVGQGTAEVTAERAGIPADAAGNALQRLLELNYVLRQEESGEAVYRMAARALKG